MPSGVSNMKPSGFLCSTVITPVASIAPSGSIFSAHSALATTPSAVAATGMEVTVRSALVEDSR